MSKHQQYNLVFQKLKVSDNVYWAVCRVTHGGENSPLEGELRSILGSSNEGEGLVDTLLEETNKILTGTWSGFEENGDNTFFTETNESIRLDLVDGYAYLGQEDYGWNQLPRISLIDLKAILEEWISFRNSM